jgi:hypothetical protein
MWILHLRVSHCITLYETVQTSLTLLNIQWMIGSPLAFFNHQQLAYHHQSGTFTVDYFQF